MASEPLPSAEEGPEERGHGPGSAPGSGIGGEFVAALVDRDAPRLGACLDAEVRLRALVPSGYQEHRGSPAVVSRFMTWFEEPEEIQVLDKSERPVVDRLQLRYRFREVYADGETAVIEQNAICDLRAGRIASIDLVCSGHRPEPTVGAVAIRHFDAGELGCGSGFPQEFRRQLAAIPLGSTLEVTTLDPSAKEDLPSLARLLGHRVVSVTASPTGGTVVAVQRVR